jgi:hypothetical protein
VTERLYIYVKDWHEHQPRSDRPNLPWLRLHTKLLGNDAWLELSPPDTKLLVTIWMLAQRYGNGRVKADQAWLMGQANVAYGPRSHNLERLVQAGFLTLATTKAEPSGGLEEKRGEEPLKGSSPPLASSNGVPATPNGAGPPPNPVEWTEEAETQHRQELAAAAREAIREGRE